MIKHLVRFSCVLSLLGALGARAGQSVSLLNVSYDSTREFYQEVNAAFAKEWKSKTGDDAVISQSHGGSGKQARSVIDGLQADVVTLGVATDIDALHTKADLVPENWQQRLPSNSCPYSSTVIFMVRHGNRAKVKDWEDLARPGVSVIVPNPKTSAAARWIYLAAYGWALQEHHRDAGEARQFVEKLYRNVPVMDEGARGSVTTFAQRGIGDVLVCWESDALVVVNGFGRGGFEIVYPSRSIRAEPPVALVDKNADQHGTRAVAEAYLKFLYTPDVQEMAVRHYFRPSLAETARAHEKLFPPMPMFTVKELFGTWGQAQKTHFDEGGLFDQIAKSRR
ncbi:MAG TPA: sulfate ABC transporter substrate-binding protein [Verrucomicrobiae bacterium]